MTESTRPSFSDIDPWGLTHRGKVRMSNQDSTSSASSSAACSDTSAPTASSTRPMPREGDSLPTAFED